VSEAALGEILARLREALRDWPEGVREGNTWATVDQCLRLRSEARRARRLDGAGEHAEFLGQAEARLNIHIGHLRSEEGKCFF
jgi:hypothetical protein